jgi:hypothetical protein
VGEADWVFRSAVRPAGASYWLGLRYQLQRVEPSAGGGVDANALGLAVGVSL